jgi:hypothetical protein
MIPFSSPHDQVLSVQPTGLVQLAAGCHLVLYPLCLHVTDTAFFAPYATDCV